MVSSRTPAQGTLQCFAVGLLMIAAFDASLQVDNDHQCEYLLARRTFMFAVLLFIKTAAGRLDFATFETTHSSCHRCVTPTHTPICGYQPCILFYRLSNCQLSVTEPFRLPPLESAMHCLTDLDNVVSTL